MEGLIVENKLSEAAQHAQGREEWTRTINRGLSLHLTKEIGQRRRRISAGHTILIIKLIGYWFGLDLRTLS